MDLTDGQIAADIFHKLHMKRVWGAKHTSIENVYRWCPSHLRGKYKEVAKTLVKSGFLIPKITHYGLQVSLNPRRREEVIEIIKRSFNY